MLKIKIHKIQNKKNKTKQSNELLSSMYGEFILQLHTKPIKEHLNKKVGTNRKGKELATLT